MDANDVANAAVPPHTTVAHIAQLSVNMAKLRLESAERAEAEARQRTINARAELQVWMQYAMSLPQQTAGGQRDSNGLLQAGPSQRNVSDDYYHLS